MNLAKKITNKTARIAVIGLGYVGLPLAVEFAREGFPVLGVDIDNRKIGSLTRGISYIPDVPTVDLKRVIAKKKFSATTDNAALAQVDVIFICVPTPFDAMKAPDLEPVLSATRSVALHLQAGQLVILQSTTYPGTTEEVCLPILETSGLRAGKDFHLAFSPERIDPGHTQSQGWDVKNTPKTLGGLTPRCTALAKALLEHLTKHVFVVSSPRAAEMSKLLENIFRSVNIALVNELALLCERMEIDIWEVIDAAKTKPFGFMPFYPGAGVGGHCIPVDPYYLSWKAREYDFYTRFIELAADINQGMPYHAVKLASDLLGRRGKSLTGSNVLVLGVAFKPNVDDARNSPAERVIEILSRYGAQIQYHDPYVRQFHVGGDVFRRERVDFESIPLTRKALRECDVAIIVTAHSKLNYRMIVENAPLIVDSANATKGLGHAEKIVRVGAPQKRSRSLND